MIVDAIKLFYLDILCKKINTEHDETLYIVDIKMIYFFSGLKY